MPETITPLRGLAGGRPRRCADAWSAGPLQVRVWRDANDVPADAWDSLLGPDDLQTSHRFVRLCQETCREAEFWHVMVYQGDRPCGVASLSRVAVRLDLIATGVTRSLLQLPRRVWPGFLRVPVLFGGLPVSFGQPCLKLAPSAGPAVVTALAQAAKRIAATTSTQLTCFKEFDPTAAEELRPLEGEGFFRAPSLPSCSLPLPWGSFAAYLGAMTAGYRRQVRATLRARQEASLRVRIVERFSREGDVIHSLYRQVIERARHRLETLDRAFIDRLDVDLGDRSRAIFLERDGRTLAVAVMLFTPNVATFLLAGLDYAAPRHWQVYANLVCQVVAEAIGSGASRLELGQTSYPLKSRLGAAEVPRYLYLRHRRPLSAWLLRRCSPLLFPEYPYPRRRVFREDQTP
jgi:hypothetical protein